MVIGNTHTQGSFDSYYPHKKFEADWFATYKNVPQKISIFKNKPLISIIIVIDELDGEFLEASIHSVLQQSYPFFEILFSVNESVDPNLVESLSLYTKKNNNQVKLVKQDSKNNRVGILRMVEGEYLLFLSSRDKLAKHALLAIVDEVNEGRSPNIIYTDEDMVDLNDDHLNPHFKGQWNPDLFYSFNYIGHSVVFKRSIFDENSMVELQKYSSDFVYVCLLFAISLSTPEKIRHVAKVLYHYRYVRSGSSDKCKHDFSLLKLFLNKKITREEIENIFEQKKETEYRICYALPKPNPLVSLLIPTRDHMELIKNCVDSILEKTTYSHFEILILDNQSEKEETIDYFRHISNHPKIRVIPYDKAFNYSAINNFGVEQANGEILGFINNDIEVINAEWLTEMVSHVTRQEIGCVGAKLYYENDTIQHAGVILGVGGIAGHSHKHMKKSDKGYFNRLVLVQNLSAVTAACLLVRKHVFNEVGGLNEEHLTVAYNDVDFCLEVANRGYRNLWTPYAELYHHESLSRGRDDVKKNSKRFNKERQFMKKKWGHLLQKDPYYNPNLTLKKQDFSVKKYGKLLGLF